MFKKIIFVFLLLSLTTAFRAALASSPNIKCLISKDNFFTCQNNLTDDEAQPLTIKDRDGSTFYITPQAELGLEAAKYKFLTLRLKAKTDFPRFQINFADRGVGILTLNDFIFKNNNRFTDYYFNLSLFDRWGGTVDRLYLQFVPQDIEIESFALSPTTPALMIKSLWQEFLTDQPLTDQPKRLSWINGLSAPSLSGVPFIKYLLAIVLIVVVVLAIFKYRDKALAKKWPKILLIIFLVGWLIAAARTLYSSYSTYLNDRPLWRMAPSAKSEQVLGALAGNPEAAKNLYSFLASIKANIPAGAAIFMPSDSSYAYVLMVYNLVDQYQVVADINQADYLVLFEQLPSASPSLGGPVSPPDFKLKFTFGPNQLIYQR